MFSMLVKARQLSLPIDIKCDLFDKIVLPVLLYGCEIWGHRSIDKLEIFYRNFLLKLNKSTPSGMVYGELCLQIRV